MPLARGNFSKTTSTEPAVKPRAKKQATSKSKKTVSGGSVYYVKRKDANQLTKIC
jgi:hypothetical protein